MPHALLGGLCIRPTSWELWRQKSTSPSNWIKLKCAISISTWRIQHCIAILSIHCDDNMYNEICREFNFDEKGKVRGYRTGYSVVRSQFYFVVLVSHGSMAPLWVAPKQRNYCITQCSGNGRNAMSIQKAHSKINQWLLRSAVCSTLSFSHRNTSYKSLQHA